MAAVASEAMESEVSNAAQEKQVDLIDAPEMNTVRTPQWVREASAGFSVRGAIASEIIPNSLWLGRGQFPLEADLMSQAQITHVLTVANDTPEVKAAMTEMAQSGKIGYLCLDIGDFGTDEGISRVFGKAFAFLDAAIDEGGVAFVHCANGSNRSPTLVIGYLKHRFPSLRLDQAAQTVLLKRPHIMPLKDNLAQLAEWSGEPLDENSFQKMKKASRKAWKKLNQ